MNVTWLELLIDLSLGWSRATVRRLLSQDPIFTPLTSHSALIGRQHNHNVVLRVPRLPPLIFNTIPA